MWDPGAGADQVRLGLYACHFVTDIPIASVTRHTHAHMDAGTHTHRSDTDAYTEIIGICQSDRQIKYFEKASFVHSFNISSISPLFLLMIP